MEVVKVTDRFFKVKTDTISVFFETYAPCLGGVELFDKSGICGYLDGINASSFALLVKEASA